jgi:signal transduction histidine kinase
MKLTIRLKFLIVMCSLLVICLGAYLGMSITVFKSDKTQLVYDLNRSQVSNLANEIETTFGSLSESLQLFAQVPLDLQGRVVDSLLGSENEIVALAIYKSQEFSQPSQIHYRESFFETYAIPSEEREKHLKDVESPAMQALQKGQTVWNASLPDGPPLIGFAKRLILLDERRQPIEQWVIAAYLKVDNFLRTVKASPLSQIYVTNQEGQVLLQNDLEALIGKPSLKGHSLFSKAKASAVKLSVTQIQEGQSRWLAAYTQTFHGSLFVMAQSPEDQVFAVVSSIAVRTLLFGSLVLTMVILAAFLISGSLTENISLLARRMSSASEGDLSSLVVLKSRDETALLASAFNTMITDLKRSRDALQELNRELDAKVKERTRQLEIQNRKVVEAQEALLRTTRLASMGEVAGRAAHEVLNPLTSLLTRLGLTEKRMQDDHLPPLRLLGDLQQAWQEDYKTGGLAKLTEVWSQASTIPPHKTVLDEDLHNLAEIKGRLVQSHDEVLKDLRFLRDEGSRIGKIIHGMRRLGNLDSSPEQNSIHPLLSDCLDIMGDLLEQEGVVVERAFAAETDQVILDKDEFVQAVTNLLRNSLQSFVTAKKQNPQFQPRLQIKTQTEKGQLVIDLIDNGVGVAPEDQNSLFSSHFTTKSREEGTGIGLSISRRFLRAHNGDIQFMSSVEFQATHFRITLPLIHQIPAKAVA